MNNRREFLKSTTLGTFGLLGLNRGILPSAIPAPNWKDPSALFDISSDLIYLNTGTMGLSPLSVQEKYIETIHQCNRLGRYNRYKEELYSALASFLNCETRELAMMQNVTQGINTAVWSLPLKEGDEIILSRHEHAGAAIPWLNRAARDELKLVLVDLGESGAQTLQNISDAITEKTRVICVPHIPCTIGHILPIKEICELARNNHCYSLIDGAHGPGMIKVDLKEIGCDIYASCFHKWMLGPKGMGFTYFRTAIIDELSTFFSGEHDIEGWNFGKENFFTGKKTKGSAGKFNNGTQSDPQMAAALESIHFLNSMEMKEIETDIRSKGAFLMKELRKLSNIEVLSSISAEETAGIVSFRPKYKSHSQINEEVNKENFRIRSVSESDINCLRISVHIYNTMQDIEKFVSYLSGLVK